VFNAAMEDNPSERLIDQRVRNRIMEAVHTLASGDEGVLREWPGGYVENFYTWVPHHEDGDPQSNSAITAKELEGLLEVRAILDEACDATPKIMTAAELIETGWPSRVQSIAQKALSLMLARGRFDENKEEAEPSAIQDWP
jgi:hypothetical protein